MAKRDPLALAREELASLETSTPTLQAALKEQNAELDRLRRASREGGATFDEVVAQQTRRDAAAGILQQHMDDLAHHTALIAELEHAASEEAELKAVREAWATVTRAEAEFAQEAEALQDTLRQAVERLRELQADHRRAQTVITDTLVGMAAREVGQTVQQARDTLSDFVRARSHMHATWRAELTDALVGVAELADPDHAGELLALTRKQASFLGPGPKVYGRHLGAEPWPDVARIMHPDAPAIWRAR